MARFISVMKFKDLGFRANHSFVVADRFEDLTQPDAVRQNAKCDRRVCLYGYVRGCPLKRGSSIHIPGCGDFQIDDVTFLTDPCPLPSAEKKRTLDDRERLIYAPFSGVGGIVYDKDAVYIELGGSHSHRGSGSQEAVVVRSANPYISGIIGSKNTVDSKLSGAKLSIFSTSQSLTSADADQMKLMDDERDAVVERRRVRFEDDDENDPESDKESSETDEDNLDDGDEDDEEKEDDVDELDYSLEEDSMVRDLILKSSKLED